MAHVKVGAVLSGLVAGGGNIVVALPIAAKAGDIIVGIVFSTIDSGANWAAAGGSLAAFPAGWDCQDGNTNNGLWRLLGSADNSGNQTNFAIVGFLFPSGALAKGTSYTFIAPTGFASKTLLVMYREQYGKRAGSPFVFEDSSATGATATASITPAHSPNVNPGYQMAWIMAGSDDGIARAIATPAGFVNDVLYRNEGGVGNFGLF